MGNQAFQGGKWIWQRLEAIEEKLDDLRKAIEVMAIQTVVKQNEFEQIKYQVASFAEGLRELENRVIVLERHNSLERWVVRQVGTILLVVLAAYLVTRFV